MWTYILVLFWIHVICLSESDANINSDTKCFGNVPSCATHHLICANETVINITKADFGYRRQCNDANGLATCQNTKCCNEKKNDCHVPFTDEEYQNVHCNGKRECLVRGMRRFDNVNLVCNGRTVSAYSRLEYTCISPARPPRTTKPTSAVITSALTKTTSTTIVTSTTTVTTTSAFITTIISQRINTTETDSAPIPSTENPDDDKQVSDGDGGSNTGGIVGGIVGTLVVIVIVVIVIILYRRKVQQKSNSEVPKTKTNKTVDPHYFTVDDAATLNRNITSQYDEIDLDADTTPQYSEGYDHILAQQIKASKSKQNNNSNHISGGTGGGAQIATEDDYNLLNRNKIQKFDPALAVAYQHIGEIPENNSKNNFITEDNYQHIGENPANSSKNNLITEDNYQHIGEYPANISKNNFITEDDYQHIGENPANNSKNTFITEDDYQHIGENPANSSKNNLITDDNYQHIGLPEVQLNQDGDDYNHIGNLMIARDTTITKNTDNNSGSLTPRTFRPNSKYQLAYSPNGGDVKQTGGYEIATLVENQNTESDYELASKSDC